MRILALAIQRWTFSLLAGAIALLGLIIAWRKPGGEQTIGDYVRHHKEPHKWIMIAVLIVGLADIYFLSITAYKGGLIRHPEIQPGYQPPEATAPANPADTAGRK